MKHLLVIVCLVCNINCFAQAPSPDLFQTWYLTFVQGSDLSEPYNVYGINPTITPTLTITNDLTFTGFGACNSFTGSFANVDNLYWLPGSFSATILDCGTQNLNNFESNYFSFLQSMIINHYISSNNDGQVLMMYNPLFGYARFQNYPLKTKDFYLDKINVYPNPIDDRINIDDNQFSISKVFIVNSLGQNIRTFINDFDVLDISDLSQGTYVLKIETEVGTVCRKIIKR